MLYLSKTIFVYRFHKILVIEPTTEVNTESIGAPSVKEIDSVVYDQIIPWLITTGEKRGGGGKYDDYDKFQYLQHTKYMYIPFQL
jgi:hypothetical protein